ncbi:MAG TPA: hypothetical protein VJT72_04465, partial [Pseudonocardiaceae bacterium]|nr:hypothetical protein [Pseudonocardiaceae bacterium]
LEDTRGLTHQPPDRRPDLAMQRRIAATWQYTRHNARTAPAAHVCPLEDIRRRPTTIALAALHECGDVRGRAACHARTDDDSPHVRSRTVSTTPQPAHRPTGRPAQAARPLHAGNLPHHTAAKDSIHHPGNSTVEALGASGGAPSGQVRAPISSSSRAQKLSAAAASKHHPVRPQLCRRPNSHIRARN